MPTTAATQSTAPVAGTSAGRYSFSSPVSWLSIRNQTGVKCYFLFNNDSTDAAVAAADLELADGQSFTGQLAEICPGGQMQDVSVWVPTSGTVAQLYIRGS